MSYRPTRLGAGPGGSCAHQVRCYLGVTFGRRSEDSHRDFLPPSARLLRWFADTVEGSGLAPGRGGPLYLAPAEGRTTTAQLFSRSYSVDLIGIVGAN